MLIKGFTLLLAFVATITAIGQTSRSGQVALKNGDRLTGKIVSVDDKKLILITDFAGELTIQKDAIDTVTSGERLYITTSDGRTISGLVSTVGDQLIVKGPGGCSSVNKSTVKFNRSAEEQAAYERTLHPGWLELWSGSGTLGLALTAGNSETTNLALGLGLSRETARDKSTLYAAGIFATDKTTGVSRTTANIIRTGFRYDRNCSRKWFGYGTIDFEHNDLQDLSLRVAVALVTMPEKPKEPSWTFSGAQIITANILVAETMTARLPNCSSGNPSPTSWARARLLKSVLSFSQTSQMAVSIDSTSIQR
jgi:hypothetical protein